MLFRKRLLVSALALNLFALPAFADLSLDIGSIQDTGQVSDKIQIGSPSPGMEFIQGDPVVLDFVAPKNSQVQAVIVDGMRVEFPPRLTGGIRFQGLLFGAADILGKTQIQFEIYNSDKGVFTESVEIEVKGTSQPADIPPLEIRAPQDGQILDLGQPLDIDFTTPNSDFRMEIISINGHPLHEDWYRIPADTDYRRQIPGFTQQPGPLKVVFEYRRLKDGRIFKLEKNLSVSGEITTPMEITSPLMGSRYSQGDVMPVQVQPSSTNDDPNFVIYLGSEQLGKVNEKPYHFDYEIPSDPQSLGQREVRVEEYDGDRFVDQKVVWVEFMPSTRKVKLTLEVKEGTAAVADSTSATLVATVQGYRDDEPIPDADFNPLVEGVEFYLNDELVETDTTPPYEFTRQYSNSEAESGLRYSTLYTISARAIVSDEGFRSEIMPFKYVEAMPLVGAEYCKVTPPTWNLTTPYSRGDAVQDRGFFYVANLEQTGERPDDKQSSWSTPYWSQVYCSEQFIRQVEPSIIPDKSYVADVGETLDISGKVQLPADRTLSALVMTDVTGSETILPVDTEGRFSFPYLFEGRSSCINFKCESIYLDAIDNLDYKQKGQILVMDNDPPVLDSVTTRQFGDWITVNFQGRDEGLFVTATVFPEGSETAITSIKVPVSTFYGPGYFRDQLRFKAPESAPSKYVLEIKDEAGQSVRETFTTNY